MSTRSSDSRMVAPMIRSKSRFSVAEVVVHAAFATLIVVAIATAALLSVDALSVWFGRRELVAHIHVVAGLLLPVPLALALLSPAFRDDARALEQMTPSDREWLRSRDRRSGRIPVERFNAGQKLNAAFTVGAVCVLLGTGLIMGSMLVSWPTKYRTGATWVHDWTAFALTIAVVGHVYFALRYRRGDSSNAHLTELTSPSPR